MKFEHTLNPYINIVLLIFSLLILGFILNNVEYYHFALLLIGYKLVQLIQDFIIYLSNKYN